MKEPLSSKTVLFLFFSLFVIFTVSIAMRRSQSTSTMANGVQYEAIIEEDIAYGPQTKQKLDLCRPKNAVGKRPGVMLVHGGGGDKSQHRDQCRALAERGMVAIAVNYREDPPPTWKVILGDNALAMDWLLASSDVDGGRIGAMGGSLGGYVASYFGTYDDPRKVDCAVNNYGPTDFTDPNLKGSTLYDEFVAKFFGGVTYEENPQLYERLSPITHVTSDDAPRWLFTRSTNDHLVPRSQMERMTAALGSVGIQSEVYEYDGSGGGHANKLPPLKALQLFRKRIDFLETCL